MQLSPVSLYVRQLQRMNGSILKNDCFAQWIPASFFWVKVYSPIVQDREIYLFQQLSWTILRYCKWWWQFGALLSHLLCCPLSVLFVKSMSRTPNQIYLRRQIKQAEPVFEMISVHCITCSSAHLDLCILQYITLLCTGDTQYQHVVTLL